ncbi:hypothetical protein B0T24DRAFT_110281 [Lasiosphaeria ovina]|uniref:SnoaL-like domain-containing protein n=1 Tax=Lasiosphaeria ovina TaxID=92902 RepID=A0AAE0JTE6_9PEZI|nr:hypothetical protein B0T24DRAFT_110281 [Lasiosphaeria ovina]
MATATAPLAQHLKARYLAYRATADFDAKGLFYSDSCLQVCRPQPSYAAQDRATIVQYLREAAAGGLDLATSPTQQAPQMKGCTIRLATADEFEFASDEATLPAGFTAAELKLKAQAEGWVGTRVDLWSESPEDESREMLVKVKYWWRRENGEWVQILHDIMYMGPHDGTQGTDGEVL